MFHSSYQICHEDDLEAVTRVGVTWVGVTRVGVTRVGVTRVGVTKVVVTTVGFTRVGVQASSWVTNVANWRHRLSNIILDFEMTITR